jgi:uncharacterized membrane protein YbhN (UPF0104 family)
MRLPKYAVTLVLLVTLWLLGFVGLAGVIIQILSRLLDLVSNRLSGRDTWLVRIGTWSAKVAKSLSVAARDSAVLRRISAITVMRYGLISVEFTLIARALGLKEIGFLEILVALPVAQTGLLIAVTPGGLGFLEGGFWGAFKAMNLAPEAISTFLVGQRVLNGLFILVLAASSFVSRLMKEK